jgi:hypothetical protein
MRDAGLCSIDEFTHAGNCCFLFSSKFTFVHSTYVLLASSSRYYELVLVYLGQS